MTVPRRIVCAVCGASPFDGFELKRVKGELRCREHRALPENPPRPQPGQKASAIAAVEDPIKSG